MAKKELKIQDELQDELVAPEEEPELEEKPFGEAARSLAFKAADLSRDAENTPVPLVRQLFSVAPQTILAAGSIIRPESTIMNIIATIGGGAVTLTSNPSIADGINGQLLILRGSSATDTITLTDGNGMKLAGNVTLALNDTLTLYFDGTVTNDWIEITRSTNG